METIKNIMGFIVSGTFAIMSWILAGVTNLFTIDSDSTIISQTMPTSLVYFGIGLKDWQIILSMFASMIAVLVGIVTIYFKIKNNKNQE